MPSANASGARCRASSARRRRIGASMRCSTRSSRGRATSTPGRRASGARLERLAGAHPRHAVAITAATEHFTAILAEHMLLRPQVARRRRAAAAHALAVARRRGIRAPRHGLRPVPGAGWQRALAAALVPARQLAFPRRRIAPDGAQPGPRRRAVARSTWRSAARFFCGRDGLLRHTFGPWRGYWSARFHPLRQGGEAGMKWLKGNTGQYASLP